MNTFLGRNIKDIVNEPVWQALRQSLVGTWKLDPEGNVKKLRNYLESGPGERIWRLARLRNYTTASVFRMRIVTHPEIDKLRDEVRDEIVNWKDKNQEGDQ